MSDADMTEQARIAADLAQVAPPGCGGS